MKHPCPTGPYEASPGKEGCLGDPVGLDEQLQTLLQVTGEEV